MSRSALAVAVCLAVVAVSPSSAAQPPLRFFSADGTWDCKDEAGARAGTVVLAETAYAFIKTDGKLGGYGKFSPFDADFSVPLFVVTSGPLIEEMKVSGLAIRGPENDQENLNGELYMYGAVGLDAKHHWFCTRRGGRANEPPA